MNYFKIVNFFKKLLTFVVWSCIFAIGKIILLKHIYHD